MTIRRAIATDKTWIAALWTASASIWASTWPEPVQTVCTAADAARDIASSGQRIYVRSQKDGFFITHAGMLPEKPSSDPAMPPGGLASQLVFWVVSPTLSAGQQRIALGDLMRGWLQDEVLRGEFEYGFGEVPEAYISSSLTFLNAWNIHLVRFERNGVRWLRYWYRMADAIAKVPA